MTPRGQALLAITLSLIFASGLCVALFVFRAGVTGWPAYNFLVWNLILAWAPFMFAVAACAFARGRSWLSKALVPACVAGWLLFFPNAPYVLTDLMHLHPNGQALFWFDLVMLLSFALTSLFLGFVSLYLLQELVTRFAGRAISWLFVALALGLSGFGIYLGRFLRWNSWDIIADPFGLAADILDRLLNPLAHPRTWAVSILFSALCLAAYFILFAFTRLRAEPAPAS